MTAQEELDRIRGKMLRKIQAFLKDHSDRSGAERLGVSSATVNRLKKDPERIALDTLAAMAKKIG